MNITNRDNLPVCLVDLLKADQQKELVDKRYSVTQIIGNLRELMLIRKHYDDISIDVADSVNTIFGSAVHNLIEKFDKTGMAEMSLEYQIGDYVLSGRVDLYDEKNHTLIDWKTASNWKVEHSDFEDYKRQGLVYTWLLLKNGYIVDKLQFHMFIKDKGKIHTWEYKVTTRDLVEIEKFIYDRFNLIKIYEHMEDDELPDCENTWYTGDTYAVYKKSGQARADRVLDTEQEAHDYISNKLNGAGIIEVRKGQHRKCQEYCICKDYCKYWKDRR